LREGTMTARPHVSLGEYPEIAELPRDRNLSFPIPAKEDFIDQMTGSGMPVVFRKISYDPHFAEGGWVYTHGNLG
ncbi:MAG: hypothetical protein ABI165_07325, partial [Bryobacteraceae bacterium]